MSRAVAARRARGLAVSVVALCSACAAGAPARMRPAVLEWQIGLADKGGPSPLLETILPATYRGKAVWRVVHRDPDPVADGTQNAYDLYDVDPDTLIPIRTVSAHEGFYLGLAFEGDRAIIEKREGETRVESEVRVERPMPEGPGLQVLLASLPLRPGYATTFSMVDRWARDEASRVQAMTLTVSGRQTIGTRMGRCDVLEVTVAPRDGSFRIRAWVRAEPPRYAVKMEYTRGDLFVVSEVVRMVVSGLPERCGS